MSKYNLSDLHKGSILKESMSRGGTVTDSFYSIANNADEIDGQNIGKDTYPIEVKRLGPSSDDKTNEEIIVRYGSDLKDYFSIYDYKFGEDPTSEDNFDKEYSFSLGVPTGKGRETLTWAKKLGFEVDEMNENMDNFTKTAIADEIAQWREGNLSKEQLKKSLMDLSNGEFQLDSIKGFNNEATIKEEEGSTKVSTKEIKFHLDAYKSGNINGDDLAQAIEEIVFGETKAPGMEEEKDRPGYHKDGTPKSNAEMSDDEREEFYNNLDSVDENLKEHFARFK